MTYEIYEKYIAQERYEILSRSSRRKPSRLSQVMVLLDPGAYDDVIADLLLSRISCQDGTAK